MLTPETLVPETQTPPGDSPESRVEGIRTPMTVPGNPNTLEPSALIEQLVRYRLLPPERIPTLRPGMTTPEFVAELVKASLLTPYQAEKALAGQISQLVVGPYRITTRAKGTGFGSICTARSGVGNSLFRMRLLPLRSLWQARVAKRLVQAQAHLPAHPVLARLVDVDTAHGQHYLVWPFQEGHTLVERVREQGVLTAPDVAKLIRTLAEALSQCHRQGLEFGFLGPDNVLLTSEGDARLQDLGAGPLLALNLSESETMLDSLSEASFCANLIANAAPELLQEPIALSPSADQFGLGIIAHFALTGLRPFEEEDLLRTLIVRQEPVAPIRELDPRVAVKLAEVVDRMLSVDPSDRFLSMEEVVQALTEFLVEEGIEAPPSVKMMEPEIPASLEQLSHRSGSGSGSNGSVSWSSAGPDLGVRPVERDDSDASIQFDLPAESVEMAAPVGSPPAKDMERVGFNLTVGPLDQALDETRIGHRLDLGGSPTPSPDRPAPLSGASRLDGISRLLSSIETTDVSLLDDLVRLPTPGVQPKRSDLPTPSPSAKPVKPDATKPEATKTFVGQPGTTSDSEEEDVSQSVLWKSVKRSVLFWQSPSDRLQVSLFGPPSLVPGTTVELELFLHTPEAADNVRTMSRAFLRESELLSTGKVAQEVKRESSLAIHIALANAGLSQSLMGLIWRGQPHRLRLAVHVPWESPAGFSPGIISIGKENVRIGRVDFQVNILPRTS